MSALTYARKVPNRSSAATSSASAGSVAATATAVGSPRATSSAKLGPEMMPTGAGQRGASTWCASPTPAGSAAEAGTRSRPFDNQTSGARAPAAARPSAISGSAAMGLATISSFAAAATARSLVTASVAGSANPGR